jgi:hypothetical protein
LGRTSDVGRLTKKTLVHLWFIGVSIFFYGQATCGLLNPKSFFFLSTMGGRAKFGAMCSFRNGMVLHCWRGYFPGFRAWKQKYPDLPDLTDVWPTTCTNAHWATSSPVKTQKLTTIGQVGTIPHNAPFNPPSIPTFALQGLYLFWIASPSLRKICHS